MSKKMGYSFQWGNVSKNQSEILKDPKTGKPITVDLQISEASIRREEYLTKWEKESKESNFILGQPYSY